jgi:hypothetical protein
MANETRYQAKYSAAETLRRIVVQVGNDSWRTLRDTTKKGIQLELTPDGSVGQIYLPGSDGDAWTYSRFSQESSGGSATAVKSDKTYTVSGKVIGIDNKKASGAFRDFELTVTSPYRR